MWSSEPFASSFELPSVLSAGLGTLYLVDSLMSHGHLGLGKPNSNSISSMKFFLVSKGHLLPLSSKLKQTASMSSNSLLLGALQMFCVCV